jgi:hypothetical protein
MQTRLNNIPNKSGRAENGFGTVPNDAINEAKTRISDDEAPARNIGVRAAFAAAAFTSTSSRARSSASPRMIDLASDAVENCEGVINIKDDFPTLAIDLSSFRAEGGREAEPGVRLCAGVMPFFWHLARYW